MAHHSEFLAWGNNQSNLLSKSSSKCLSTPVPLSLPYEIVSICASEKHISILTKDGQLYSYGSNLDGRLGVSTRSVDKVSYSEPIKVQLGSKIIRVESGFSHMCVLTDKLQLFSWGLGDYGALGTGQFKSRSTPTKVDLSKQLISKLRQISCGAMHTAFLFDDGDVYTCGSNQYGELGVNKPQKVSTPIPISFHMPVIQVSCGVFYTLLLTKEGKVYGMGNNKYGQLGTGHKVNECHPTLIRELNDIVKVTAGYHSGAIDKFGNLYIWGSGSFGELLRPKKFVLSVPIKDIAIRGFFGIAIGNTSKNQTRIYSWGNNTFGELGLGTYQASKQPQEVQTLRGLQVNKIALGVNFAMVLLHPPLGANKWVEQINEQRSKSEKKRNRDKERQREEEFSNVSEKRSIIGFEQKYLNSNKKKSQDYGNSKPKETNQFQVIKTNNKRDQKNYNSQRFNDNISSQRIEERMRDRSYSNKGNRRQTSKYLVEKQKEASHINTSQKQGYTQLSHRNDYQKLFLQLSEDYQTLVRKYNDLERQISGNRTDDYGSLKLLQQKEKELANENFLLKDQLSKISYDLIRVNDEVRSKNRRIQQLMYQNERILSQQVRMSNITLSPRPIDHPVSLSAEIQQEYNKLLTEKEQIITKLSISLSKMEQQFKMALNRSNEENNSLRNQLNLQMNSSKKILNSHQALIDELEAEIKRSEQVGGLLRQQNQTLKIQINSLKNKSADLEQFQTKVHQIQVRQKQLKQRYEQDLKDSKIKGEVLTGKVAELEVELEYQKEFNRKYQQSLLEIKQSNEKLHKELDMQVENNIEKASKIQGYKSEIEKLKRYKKQVDEKNIQIEEFNANFETFRKKTKQIMEQKEKQLKVSQQNYEKELKQLDSKLQRKSLEVQDMARQNNRVEKQISKNKEQISTLKNQLCLKDDEVQHLSQLKANLQKKVNMLSLQMNKQIQERESMIKDLGEHKRQLSKFKMMNAELETKLQNQIEEKNKFSRYSSQRDEEIARLKQEMDKINEKCQNLKKENNVYREQIQDVSFQLENQSKINEELARANKQFAESQDEFSQKINELQNKIYELEDENKSYTPRYEALLIRNRQLDDRNRELGEMINKAIQIQAESYKNNILKEVQINTGNIINQYKQEQQFQFKGRRNKKQSKDLSKQVIQQQGNLTQRGGKTSEIVKQEPYTKMMKERITQHKRKVSESAQKLASLLDLNQKGRSSKGIGSDRHNTDDYEKINSQMESFNHQKEEFMSKINTFAEKLKII